MKKFALQLLGGLLALEEGRKSVLIPSQLRGDHKVIGVVSHLLTDDSRTDPFDPEHAHRKVLVRIFYPTTPSRNSPSPYGPTQLLRGLEKEYGVPENTLDLVGLRAEANAPFDTVSASNLPLVLFSPGFGVPSNTYAAMTAGLASHGYVSATVDHAYDAALLEYPDGTVVRSGNLTTDQEMEELARTRIADMEFVLRSMAEPEQQGRFISGCEKCRCYDAGNVGVFGHSFGGSTAADVMLQSTSRIRAGISVDGAFSESATSGDTRLPGPFMIMQTPTHNRTTEKTYQAFWNAHSGRGWLAEVGFKGYKHLSYSDLPILVDAMGLRSSFPRDYLEAFLGTIDGLRSEEIVNAFVSDFFDMALKGRKPAVVEGSDKFPEALFET